MGVPKELVAMGEMSLMVEHAIKHLAKDQKPAKPMSPTPPRVH